MKILGFTAQFKDVCGEWMPLKRMTMHHSYLTTSFWDGKLSVGSDTFQSMENLQGFEGLSALEESEAGIDYVFKN